MAQERKAYVISAREWGLVRQRHMLASFLDAPVRVLLPGWKPHGHERFLGWGRKPSGMRALRHAKRHGVGFLLLEDGFLRSFGLGVEGVSPLSLVLDTSSVHYDANEESDIERSLNRADFSTCELQQAEELLELLRREGLSKYNSGLPVSDGYLPRGEERVLLVDQTAGDLSLRHGLVTEETFSTMLQAALEENPRARIYIKTHPDVLAGRRKGCIPRVRDGRIRWIAENFHPHDLLPWFDKVYLATSLMGLDALVLGREVHCFGMPFYAGWGLTKDRMHCVRRQSRITLQQLIAAAFIRHARYMDPVTRQPSDALTVARHIARQKRAHRFWAMQGARSWSGRVFAFGFQFWKPAMVRPFFGEVARLRFVRSVRQARRAGISSADRIAVWGLREPAGLRELADELGVPVVRVEDGFLRSVGLGADFVPPASLVFDTRGIYFDPSTPSDLEHVLQATEFSEEQLQQARALREAIVAHGLTKYNLPRQALPEEVLCRAAGRKIVLVPGQVESDASIIRGAGKVRTNLALLQAARAEEPEAFIIYKPHPDVMVGNRDGRLHFSRALQCCDHVETTADIITCIEAADTIHTMTSLAGFDALLRGKQVVCHGMPFYAGWGLTEDRLSVPRRWRQRTIDELVAATLLMYPQYTLNGIRADAFHVVHHLARELAAGKRGAGTAFFFIGRLRRGVNLLRQTFLSLSMRLRDRV